MRRLRQARLRSTDTLEQSRDLAAFNDVQTLLCELVKPGDYLLLPHLPYAESLSRESDPSKQPCQELRSTTTPRPRSTS